MISICLAYFTTLCMYPGIVSEIISCNLGSWMPILMMAIFNGADLFGKMLSSSSSYWTGGRLVRCCVGRLVLIPLILLCAVPRAYPIFSEEIFPFLFILTLGLSNGILGSVPIIQAPSKVEDYHRELTGEWRPLRRQTIITLVIAGNMMTLSYNFGLTTGSLVAYFLESILAPVDVRSCTFDLQDRLPYATDNATLSTASTSTIFETTLLTSTVLDATVNTTFEMG